jgi:hypothetical protein
MIVMARELGGGSKNGGGPYLVFHATFVLIADLVFQS